MYEYHQQSKDSAYTLKSAVNETSNKSIVKKNEIKLGRSPPLPRPSLYDIQ